MNTRQRNDLIKDLIVLPDSCHCTNRHIVEGSETAAVAVCKDSGVVRANITWFHASNGETKVKYKLPIGATAHAVIPKIASEATINEKIVEGFAEMHEHWEGN